VDAKVLASVEQQSGEAEAKIARSLGVAGGRLVNHTSPLSLPKLKQRQGISMRVRPERPCTKRGTLTAGRTSNTGVDDDERQALQAEGLDPDDPAVIAAIDLVRWELSLISNAAS
jgi:hypothetical protein